MKSSPTVRTTSLEVFGDCEQQSARESLLRLFEQTPIPRNELLVNLGLFLRSTILSKILYLNELYTRIQELPGVVIEFGNWWGANLALFQNFGSVYEPYNRQRRVLGFDSFTGYQSASTTHDGNTPITAAGNYSVPIDYDSDVLSKILACHQKDNVCSQVKRYELIKGDISHTVPKYFSENPQTIIALAYFDIALYEPTRIALETIRPHLVKGSVVAFDELNSKEMPGETLALMKTFGLSRYELRRSQFLPDRSYLVID